MKNILFITMLLGALYSQEGTIECWGFNSYGQSTPPTGTFTQVSAGYYHNCALDESGNIECWGRDNYNQVSDAPTGTFADVSGGWHSHTCAVGFEYDCVQYLSQILTNNTTTEKNTILHIFLDKIYLIYAVIWGLENK